MRQSWPEVAASRWMYLCRDDQSARKNVVAGSAGGISSPAARRTMGKPLDLHGSSSGLPSY